MSKTRKILSVVLAVALVFALSVPAFAAAEAEDNGYTQTWALGTPVATANTDEYTIDVSLTTDYAVDGVEFELVVTGDVVLKSVARGADYYAKADATMNKTTGKVTLVPVTTGANSIAAKAMNGVVAVITVTGTNGTVAIKNDPKSATNTDGTLIATRVEPEDLVLGEQYFGQELVTVGAAVNIGSTPTPVLKGINGGYVDEARKYVYGAPAGLTELSQYFTVENGTFTLTGTGTGAVLTVKDLEGTDCDTYTLIIFGDVNCDNAVNANDVLALGKHVSNVTLFTEDAVLFAADVNADAAVNANDVLALGKHVSNVTLLADNIYA